jgi:hypothetical protein
MKNIYIIFLVLLSVWSGGCSMVDELLKYKPHARNVKKSPQGGVISLRMDHREEDQKLASSMMKSQCSNQKFTIIEEGEVVVGSITSELVTKEAANKKTKKGLLGMKFTEGHDGAESKSSETTQKKEWHITYACK